MSKIPIFLSCAAVFCQSATAAVPAANVRPDFQDPTGRGDAGGFELFHTKVFANVEIASDAPSTGSSPNRIFLSESTYGHPFADTQTLALGSTFVQETLRNDGKTGVYDKLYPAGYRTATGVTASRSDITDPEKGGAFRYRWLMYGEGGADESGNPIILNLFAQTFQNTSDDTNPWYGDDDRMAAQEQIESLRGALASVPLNQELQLSLLDIYYDLAVAEMQFVNKRLAKLATIRLGLDSAANEFVIDKEIATYRELVQVTGQAVGWYSELLGFQMAGVDPGDFSPRFKGAPFGHFLFVSRVPGRSQAATELGYASATPRIFTAVDGVATIALPGPNNDFTITAATPFPENFRVVMSEGGTAPSKGADTVSIPVITAFTTIASIKLEVEKLGSSGDFTVAFLPGNNGTGTASTASGEVEQILSPDSESPVFAGYKDYRTFLTILGQMIQYKADLAKLLATRTSSGDLVEAQQLLTAITGQDSDTYIQLRGLFPDTDFDSVNLDSTGVNAALSLVTTAMDEAVGVSSFVNGSGNPVGLDPNFLLIVEKQDGETAFDSYDLLKGRIEAPGGALEFAVNALGDPTNPLTGGGAIQAYSTFLGGVSQTAGDLLLLEIELGVRFEEITGYQWQNGVNGWNGRDSAPGVIGSDLATVNRTIGGLEQQNEVLRQVLAKAREDVNKANSAVGLSEGIKDSITGAQEKYLSNSDMAYEDLAIANARSAVAQNTADGAIAVGGLDADLGSIAGGIAITYATVINGLIQNTEAKNAVRAEQNIDKVAIQYQTSLALADQALSVQQSLLAVGVLQREVLATELQLKSNFSAYAQAVADRAALIREVARVEENFQAKRKDLASAYYADPIHFQRAEGALLSADAAFRRAQKWVFMTARALEYKWQERFVYTNAQLGLADSIGSIFKARNALELKRIVQGMQFFNADRNTSPGTLRNDTATISLLNDVLTPNPADIDLDFGSFPLDLGVRVEPSNGKVVPKTQRFQNILDELRVSGRPGGGFNPAIRISIDSTQIEKGQLFAGPTYTFAEDDPTRLTDIKSGLYRDKIDWLAVHFVFKEGAVVKSNAVPAIPGNNGIDGSMTYGGNTFFRKRVPPYPDRSPVQIKNASDATIPSTENSSQQITRVDLPGEFDINPFRYFQNTDPKTRIFETFDQKDATSLEFIFSSQSAETPAVEQKITLTNGFQIRDFKELSVATTRLILNIDANQFRIEDLLDIEIVVQHRAYTRPQLKLPSSP